MPTTRSARWLAGVGLVLALVPFAACASDDEPGGAGGSSGSTADAGPLLEADCDPIGNHCGFPFPSNVYLRQDPSGKNESGKRIQFGPATLPKTGGQTPISHELFYDLDGFSPASAPMTYLPGAVATGLPTPLDIASTLDSGSPTILLDAETGALVPHWIDIDQNAQADDQRAVMMHPAVLLENERRYIVAFRRIVDTAGSAVPAPEVFAALRDGKENADPSVRSRRALYADIFAKLAAAGVAKDDLQIAWDFTTGSRESITGPLIAVRDAALAAVGSDGPEFSLKSVEENPNPDILRRIVVTMKAPLFLESATYAAGDPVPALKKDAADEPVQNGTMDVDVLIQVPNSVTSAGKHGLLQNGHGLFGSKEEGRNGYLARAANGWHWITLAVDLFGFAGPDVGIAVEGLTTKPEMLPGFFARQIQGHVNQLLAMRMMMGRVATDGIKDASGAVALDPAWIDSTLRAYRGDSQGGIMGGTYMAISTDVTRGLLGEPGTPYSVLLNRSKDSILYNGLLRDTYKDDRNVQILWSLIQLHWDRTEPSGFVPFIHGSTLPGTPEHQVLLHDAIGDHQVTTLGAHIVARAVGAKLLKSNDASKPVHRDVFGLEQASAPLSGGSAIVEWDFNLAPEPLTNTPPTDGCDPHDRVRVLTPAFDQQDKFFRTGTIDWFCNGVCNCDSANEELGCPESFQSECQ
jgi:hypothetical protein